MNVVAKMNQRREELKKNANKGFSLVELIIVIAIMAILVGIVGTQVVPYLEKSRISKDKQIISGLVTDTVTTFSSNTDCYDPTKTDYVITIASNGVVTLTGSFNDNDAKTKLGNDFCELNGLGMTEGEATALKFESKIAKGKSVTITYDATTGVAKAVVDPASDTTGQLTVESK